MNLISPTAQQAIPLTAIADIEIKSSRGAIPHRKGIRVNVVSGFIRSGVLPSVVLNRIKENMAKNKFKVIESKNTENSYYFSDYTWEYKNQSDTDQKNHQQTLTIMGTAKGQKSNSDELIQSGQKVKLFLSSVYTDILEEKDRNAIGILADPTKDEEWVEIHFICQNDFIRDVLFQLRMNLAERVSFFTEEVGSKKGKQHIVAQVRVSTE